MLRSLRVSIDRSCWLLLLILGLVAVPRCVAAQEKKAEEEHPKAAAPAGKAAESKAPESHSPAAAPAAEHGHAPGEHHDDTDLGHGNATPALHQPQEWRFDLSIFTFVVFLILLAILTKFAWGPISAALEQREETIARQIAEARMASEKAARQLKEYEARLGAATDEARQIVAQSRKDAEVAKDRIVAEAREAAGKERDRAVAEIATAKNQALDEIAQRSVQTAVSLASSIIRREVKPHEHEALIGEAIQEFSKLN